MNAITYIKNVGKSFGYAAIDVLKDYNPTITSLATNTKEFTTDLYDSIKDFKENASSAYKSNDSIVKDGKDLATDFWKNVKEDFRTGNFYNKQRMDKADEDMMNDFFGDMDFDFNFDDDFGDDFSDTDVEISKTEMSEDKKNTKAMITSMDFIGQKTANTISEATARSADYIVNASRSYNKALYGLTSKGFGEVTKGIVSANENLSSLVSLAEPLTTHMQNSATFFTHSTEYQNQMLELMKQIAKNTAPSSLEVKKSEAPKGTINNLISDNVLDLQSYFDMIKENVKQYTSMITDMFGMMDGMVSKDSMKKSATASPLSGLTKGAIKLLMPRVMKKSMEEFDKFFANFFPAFLGSLRNKDLGFLENFKEIFLPQSGYKATLNPSKYVKGKVDWDGKSRKALMDVIPFQLSQIVSALTGKEQKIFDYESGTWKSVRSISDDFKNMKRNAAESVDYEYINMLKATIDNLKAQNNQTEEELAKVKEKMKRQVDEYNYRAFHSDSADFMNIMKDNFDYENYGLDKETWNLIRDVNKANARSGKKSKRMKYNSEMFLSRNTFGNNMRYSEGEGSLYELLFNNAFEDNKNGIISTKSKGLLGVDEYNHDIFYYLQGIFQYTRHLSDNIVNFGTGRTKGTRKMQKGGKIEQIKPIKSVVLPNDKSDIDSKYQDKVDVRYSRNSIAEALDNALNSDLSDFSKKLDDDPELKKYYEDRERAKRYNEPFENDPFKDDLIDKKLKADQLFKKNKKKVKSTVEKTIDKMTSAISTLFRSPAEAMAQITTSLEVSLTKFITGTKEDDNELTLGELMKTKMDDLFKNLNEKINDFFETTPGEMMKKAFDKLFGEKDADGNRQGGFFKDWFNETKSSFKSAGRWVKEVFFGKKNSNKKDDNTEEYHQMDLSEILNGNSAKGRKVTKSGIVSVSEGELIIPAEMNPFYKKKVDKKRQERTESQNLIKYFGSFKDGGTTGGTKRPGEGETKEYNDGTVVGTAKNIISEGLHTLASGFSKFINAVMPDDKKLEQEKQNISDKIKDMMGEISGSKGAVTTGAIIGGIGTSLLTGGLVGPIIGAGVGAAAGLVINSKKVQQILFGYTDADGEHKGLFSKKVSDFMQKNIPSMAKGGVVGGAAGMFMGSPVVGAILGSAIGYVTSSQSAQRALFGSVDENGKPIDDGMISRALQEKIKKSIPGMSAGAIAGLMAGPFGGPIVNMIAGSAVGYVASSTKFNEWLFGKKDDPEDKGFAGLLKDNLINPIVGIFDKLTQEIKHTVRNTFYDLNKSIKNFINKHFLGKIRQKITGAASKSGSLLNRVVTFGGSILGGIDNKLEKRALKKGYSIKDRKLGRNLTAEERLARRNETGLATDSVYGSIDQILSMAQSEEELKDLQTLMGQMINPTAKFDKELASSKRRIGNIADRANVNTSKRDDQNLKKAFKLVKDNKFDEALELVNGLAINEDEKQNLIAEIKNAASINSNITTAQGNRKQAQNLILQNTNLKVSDKIRNALGKDVLKDTDIMNAQDLIKDEIKGRFTKTAEQKQEEMQDTVNDKIPNLLNDILHVLAGDEDKIKEIRGNLYSTSLRTEADRMRQTLEKANGEITNENMPQEGDTKIDADNNKMKFQDGRWIYDMSDTGTKENQKTKSKIVNAILQLPVIGTAINGMSGLFGKVHDKLFGTKDENGKSSGGLFSSLINAFTGEDSFVSGIFHYLSSSALGIGVKTVLSHVSAKGLLKFIGIPIALNALFNNKEVHDAFAALFGTGSGADGTGASTIYNTTTYNTKTGEQQQLDENGAVVTNGEGVLGWYDNEGNFHESEDQDVRNIQVYRDDKQNLGELAIKDILRSIGTYKDRVVTKKFIKKIPDAEKLLDKADDFLQNKKIGVDYLKGMGEKGSKILAEEAANKASTKALEASNKIIEEAIENTTNAAGSKVADGLSYADDLLDLPNNLKNTIPDNITDIKQMSLDDLMSGSNIDNITDIKQMSLDDLMPDNLWSVGDDIVGGSVDNVAKDVLGDGAEDLVQKYSKDLVQDMSETVVSKAASNIDDVAEKVIKESVDKVDDVAAKAAKSGLLDNLVQSIKKFISALGSIPQLKKFGNKVKDLAQPLFDKMSKTIAKQSGKTLMQLASKAIAIINVVMIVNDFVTGFEDAATQLKIKNPTTPMRIVSGLLRAIKNLFIISSLIPESFFYDLLIDHVAGWFGIDVSELKAQRDEAQAELDAYNEKHANDIDLDTGEAQGELTWAQYNKQVRQDYTWTERVGNAWNTTKTQVKTDMKLIKEKGIKEYTKEKASDTFKAMIEAYQEDGGGLAGAIGGIGAGFQKLLPGILGEIPKKNADIYKYAIKGDFKSVWGVGLDNFSKIESKDDEVEKAVPSVFSQIIGQVPLVISKVFATPIAGVSWVVGKVVGLLKKPFESIKNKLSKVNTAQEEAEMTTIMDDDTPLAAAVDDNIDSNTSQEDGVSKMISIVSKTSKLLLLPVKLIKSIGGKVGKFIGDAVDKVKSTFTNFSINIDTLQGYTEKGDVKSIITAKFDKGEGNIAGGFLSGIFNISKVYYTMKGTAKWIGDKLSGKKNEDGMSVFAINKEKTDKLIDKMKKYAKEGDVESIKSLNLELESGDPLSFIHKISFTINKQIRIIMATIANLAKPLKDVAEGASEKFEEAKEKFEETKEKAVEIYDSAKEGVKNAANTVGEYASNAFDTVSGWFGGRSGLRTGHSAGASFVSQVDTKNENIPVGTSNVGQIGCGPASATMALNQMGIKANLKNAAKLAGNYQTGSGVDAEFFRDYYAQNGTEATYYNKNNINSMISEINAGRPVILMGQDVNNTSKANSPFGPNNHYVVASGVDNNGNIIIKDPESTKSTSYPSSILNNVELGIGMRGGASASGSKYKPRLKKIFNRVRNRLYGLSAGAGSGYTLYQNPNQTKYNNVTGYCVLVPKTWNGTSKLPMIVFLHGDGETGANLNKIASDSFSGTAWLPQWLYTGQVYVNAIVLAPQCGTKDRSANGINALVQDVAKQYNVDMDKISIAGQSGGAIRAVTALGTAPNLYSCGVLMCGYGGSNKSNIKVPIIACTGSQDSSSLGSIKGTINEINSAGGNAELYIVKGHTHNSICNLFKSYNLLGWMINQKKGSSVELDRGIHDISEGDQIYGVNGSVKTGSSGSTTSKTRSATNIDDVRVQNLGSFSIPTEDELNKWIKAKSPNSPFNGNAKIFLEASKQSGLDPRYIISHAAVESGWGTSNIAKNKNNYFGIGAFDSSPYQSAYSFNPGLASGIIEGANWISKHYYNGKYGQTNLYKMRWNNNQHQYATDELWDKKIAEIMATAPTNTKISYDDVVIPNSSGTSTPITSSGILDYGGTSYSSSSSSSSESTSNNTSNSSGLDILGTITSAFSKIGNLFSKSEDDSSSGSYSNGSSLPTSSGDTLNYGSTTEGGSYPKITSNSDKTPLEYMKSVEGKLQYSMDGPRNPDKGSADCSSTVQWAVKKALGIDIGGSTLAQYNSKNMHTLWYAKGQRSTSLDQLSKAGLKPNDILLFSRPNSSHSAGRPDRVGHVEMYAGNGKMIGHGGGIGPKVKNIDFASDGPIMVRRINGYNDSLTEAKAEAKNERMAGAKRSASGSGLLGSSKAGRALLYSISDNNPYTEETRSIPSINSNRVIFSGGKSRISEIKKAITDRMNGTAELSSNKKNETTNNTSNGISKDTAAMLKVIITLIESLVSNTNKIDNIYEILSEYCKANLRPNNEKVTEVIDKLQNTNSGIEVDSILKDLKMTVDSILAS